MKWPKNGILWASFPLLLFQLWKIIFKYNVVHFFGTDKVGLFAGFVKTISFSTAKIVVTFHGFKSQKGKFLRGFYRFFLKRIDYVISLTEYIKKQLLVAGVQSDKITLIHPGVEDRYILCKNPAVLMLMPYILFWRNANWQNGADICLAAFKKISLKYQNLNFIFAVRPGCELDSKLLIAGQTYKNIHLFFYPYLDGIKIEELISSAKIIVLPFKELSINPQFAILETMSAGKPLITSNIESNSEIIKNRKNGILISPNTEAIVSAITDLLKNVDLTKKIGFAARRSVQTEWSWNGYGRELLNFYERFEDFTE